EGCCLQHAILGYRFDHQVAAFEGGDVVSDVESAMQRSSITDGDTTFDRAGNTLAAAFCRGIRRLRIALDHHDLAAGEQERVCDSRSHATTAENSDLHGRPFLSRKSVMRRIFSALSNSSACSSPSIAGCASRGARSA